MRFGVLVDGQLSRRRLMPRHRDTDKVVADLETWLAEAYPDIVRSIAASAHEDGTRDVAIDLHPAASPVRMSITEAGRVTVSASTVAVGPGYERLIWRVLERISEVHGIEWFADVGGPASGDGNGNGSAAADRVVTIADLPSDRPTIERTHLTWLGWALRQASEGRRLGVGPLYLGTPAGVRYDAPGALLTWLGPRDDAWLEKALADPRIAIDVIPWWADATDARCLLDRALCLMWTAVRWRPAGVTDEAGVQDEVIRLLRKAYPLDPSLPYPWLEWRELLHLRGVDDPQARIVHDRAVDLGGDRPLIGYRRVPVVVEQGGWLLEVPGSFAERRTAEEWSGSEGRREVTLAGVETGEPGRPMSADAFIDQFATGLGSEVLEHREGQLAGRARLTVADEAGMQVAVLDGYMAAPGRGAAIRVVIHDAADWEWAIELWRSLRPAPRVSRDRIEAPAPTAVLTATSGTLAGRAEGAGYVRGSLGDGSAMEAASVVGSGSR